jgi:peptide/nickel transport system permease protein
MARFVLGRLLRVAGSLVGLTMLLFVIIHVTPVNPIRLALGPEATAAQVAHAMRVYGFDQPLPVQYWDYMVQLVQGNLGVSLLTHQPVGANLAQTFPATLELVLAALFLAVCLGIPLGVWAALRRGRLADTVIQAVAVGGVAVPNFWLAVILQLFLSVRMGILPLDGQLNGTALPPRITGMVVLDALLEGRWGMFASGLEHLILPAVVLSLLPLSLITRMTRSSVLEMVPRDHVRTARAKGATEGRVVARHVLRNAFGPVLSLVGLNFGWLLGGTFIVEIVFSWPGIGQYAVNSAVGADFPAILGSAIAIGAAFALVNLLVDVIYGLMDPRIRFA